LDGLVNKQRGSFAVAAVIAYDGEVLARARRKWEGVL
jgi:hypothetical protein